VTSFARAFAKKALVLGVFAVVVLANRRAAAEIVLVQGKDYSVSTNGRVDAYLSWVFGAAQPTGNPNAAGAPYTLVGPQIALTGVANQDGNISTPRIRGGYASTILAFNIKKKIFDDLNATAKLGLWAPIQTTRIKNDAVAPDWREQYVELEGSWGSVWGGRRMSLYSRGHVALDWNLMHQHGVGHPCNVDGTGTATCGFTGVGSMFPNRNAQIGYATPKIQGFQVAAGIFDPAALPVAPNMMGAVSPANYDRTPLPRFEAEATYDAEFGAIKMYTFLNGLAQKLAQSTSERVRTVYGVGAGGRVHAGPWGVGLGTHYGKGLGTGTPFGEAVDGAGDLRTFYGLLALGNYRILDTEFALGYGTARAMETDFDRTADTVSVIKSASGIAAKIAQYFGPVVISADYMHVMYRWHRGEQQDSNVLSLGLLFGW
jgi:Gram-negative porin